MKIRVSKGATEEGIVVGNTYDKYGSKNPVVRWVMKGFEDAITALVEEAAPRTIHEIGCGEGYWVLQLNKKGYKARGCDFSSQVIEIAKDNSLKENLIPAPFEVKSIYDVDPSVDSADLILCCEVMEHLEHPEDGLKALRNITDKYLILSVPREPLWCALNFCSGKYIKHLGNTPGHIQHWSRRKFIQFVSNYFEIIEVRTPLPWTVVLCRTM